MALFSRRLSVERLDSRRMFASLAYDYPSGQEAEVPPAVTSSFHHRMDPALQRDNLQREIPAGDPGGDALIDQIAFSVAADNLAGVRAAELRLEFAPEKMDIDPASLKLGDAWRGKASLVRKVDEQVGSISVFIFSAQPLGVPEGEMLEFSATMQDAITAGESQALVELVKFELNEGLVTTVPSLSLQLTTDDGRMVELPSYVAEGFEAVSVNVVGASSTMHAGKTTGQPQVQTRSDHVSTQTSDYGRDEAESLSSNHRGFRRHAAPSIYLNHWMKSRIEPSVVVESAPWARSNSNRWGEPRTAESQAAASTTHTSYKPTAVANQAEASPAGELAAQLTVVVLACGPWW